MMSGAAQSRRMGFCGCRMMLKCYLKKRLVMKALLTPDGRITLRQKIIKTDLENLKIFL